MAAYEDELELTRPGLRPLLPRTVVALDFDGTLAPIVERPEDARALPAAVEVLSAVAERVAQVAIVTGRPAADAVRLGGLDDVPGLVVFGHYGLERWSSGELHSPGETSGVALARERVIQLAASRHGVTVEDKGHSVAVHTRQAEDPEGALDELRLRVSAIADDAGLQVTPGRFVLELRPRGADKGVAIRSLVSEASAEAIIYAGDDLGDIPAADAVRELGATGVVGVVICSESGEAVPEFRARADVVVPGPEGVLRALAILTAE
ncbi:trehalose-phosphatase [Phytoactinopolyspora alkaliphila]|uniref:Trehalose 6-phosphate phosphatase n=1 Tax=Phytoactinopolyspora alkaliphila TaxID=1783498 RepID=A0A6N9YKZ0_9ACTN|nr:trehalose-phosphatase [Phytoactinopolyspora alkaliphila]NED95590.1 trehalose-phosphatase [Phytoactinopolyspora alkaliphila]